MLKGITIKFKHSLNTLLLFSKRNTQLGCIQYQTPLRLWRTMAPCLVIARITTTATFAAASERQLQLFLH
jgi:hypothetical protein